MMDHKGILYTNNPERDWALLTEAHICAFAEQTTYTELLVYRGVAGMTASELARFFSEFGITLRYARAGDLKPKLFPQPCWKAEKPTNPGWYWWREQSSSEPKIYCIGSGQEPASGWWLGPLHPPKFDGHRANSSVLAPQPRCGKDAADWNSGGIVHRTFMRFPHGNSFRSTRTSNST